MNCQIDCQSESGNVYVFGVADEKKIRIRHDDDGDPIIKIGNVSITFVIDKRKERESK